MIWVLVVLACFSLLHPIFLAIVILIAVAWFGFETHPVITSLVCGALLIMYILGEYYGYKDKKELDRENAKIQARNMRKYGTPYNPYFDNSAWFDELNR